MVIHPLYPFGDLQFLMGDRHFERVRHVDVPGLPCMLTVEQPQSWRSGRTGDTTGGVLWEASVLLGAYLIHTHSSVAAPFEASGGAAASPSAPASAPAPARARGRPRVPLRSNGERRRSVELGSGVGALGALVAAYIGYEAVATDMPTMLATTRRNVDAARVSLGLLPGQVGVEALMWGEGEPPPDDDDSRRELVVGADIM
jgi:hypothetical protein